MRDYQSLAHTRWDCKYHLVFIPKRRRKVIYGKGESLILTVFSGFALQGIPHSNKFRLAL